VDKDTLAGRKGQLDMIPEDSPAYQENCKSFLWVKLHADISVINLLSFFLLIFVQVLCSQFVVSFSAKLLTNEDYYAESVHYTSQELGGTIAISSVGATIPLLIFIGVFYDVVGRKLPLILLLIIMGVAIITMPLFDEIYPGFCMMRIFV